MAIEESAIDVDGVPAFVRTKPGDGPPVVLVHGNPTHSEDWLPFLERLPGPALAPDLPGWGRSERPPRGRFVGTMHGLAAFLERLLERLGVDDELRKRGAGPGTTVHIGGAELEWGEDE